MAIIPEYQAVLEKSEMVAREMMVLRFQVKAEEDKHFTFTPGQFISIRVAEKLFRAYSLASAVALLPSFEICVKIIPGGKGSTYLEPLRPGDLIDFRGAFGNFVIRHPQADKIFIATGSGIAPIKAFIDQLVADQIGGHHLLAFGVRTAGHAPYLPLFRQLATERDNFEFTFCVSRPEEHDVFDLSGRVSEWTRQQDPDYFQGKDIYICGSPEMVKEVSGILREDKNVPGEMIFTEAY